MMSIVQLSNHLLFLLLLSVKSSLIDGAPIEGSSSGELQPIADSNTINRELITGLQVSFIYTSYSFNEPLVTSASNSKALDVIDSFCDLLGYYEMVKKATNQSTENGTQTVEVVFRSLQLLLEHNLEDTCTWISWMVHQGVIQLSPSNEGLFNNESCTMNEPVVFQRACALHRVRTVARGALSDALATIGPVSGVNFCNWITETVPQLLQHFNTCRQQ